MQVPTAEVQYKACKPRAAGHEAVVAQLAAEKAALKRQLRQLDADFEVPLAQLRQTVNFPRLSAAAAAFVCTNPLGAALRG